MKIVKHFILITKHRFKVFILCTRFGLFWRGLVHDLSKYSFEEFFESAKYYNGKSTPAHYARLENGYSKSWLHHKGRNKHHIEYWYDRYVGDYPVIPYKYIVEYFCDTIAASKTYNKKDYNDSKPYEYWIKKKHKLIMNPKIEAVLDEWFIRLKECGLGPNFNKHYLKESYNNLTSNQSEQKENKD